MDPPPPPPASASGGPRAGASRGRGGAQPCVRPARPRLGPSLGAFALAVALGVPLGLSMGMNRVIRGIFDPLIEFYRPLPPLAYLPLMIIWFGIGETSKVLLIFLACFAPVVLAARSGVLSASRDQINA